MRTQMDLRARRACTAAAAVGFAYAAHAALPASAQVTTPAAPIPATVPTAAPTVLPAHLVSGSGSVNYRGRVSVAGRLGPGGAGLPLDLQYRGSSTSTWQTLGSAVTSRSGVYRLTARLGHSGTLRVSLARSAAASLALGSAPIGGSGLPASTAVPTSQPMPVAVRAGIGIGSARLNVFGRGHSSVAGVVYPTRGGVTVALDVRSGHRWHTVATGRTGARGRYHLSFTPASVGSEPARLVVGADGPDVSGTRPVGSVDVFRLAEASWYGPGGTTACGQQLTAGMLGVANKTLPCGTLVTLHYGSRTVRVPVIDRGPFVAGREFDLTEATKDALGFGDLGGVWTTVA